MKTKKEFELITYIETPRRNSEPVKIDVILESRMRAFMCGKRVRRWLSTK